jgi:hypothetical protein
MADFDNNNRGSIWKNEKKEKDTHPDFTGSLNVDGVEYWVSAWKRKDGASPKAPALSFSIKPKDDQPRRQEPQRQDRQQRRQDPISTGRHEIQPPSREAVRYGVADKATGFNDDLDDSIPF